MTADTSRAPEAACEHESGDTRWNGVHAFAQCRDCREWISLRDPPRDPKTETLARKLIAMGEALLAAGGAKNV